MAAAYWRSDGNLNEALDCYRTATTVLRTGDHASDYRAYMNQVIHLATVTLLNFADKSDESAALASVGLFFGDSVRVFTKCRNFLCYDSFEDVELFKP